MFYFEIDYQDPSGGVLKKYVNACQWFDDRDPFTKAISAIPSVDKIMTAVNRDCPNLGLVCQVSPYFVNDEHPHINQHDTFIEVTEDQYSPYMFQAQTTIE